MLGKIENMMCLTWERKQHSNVVIVLNTVVYEVQTEQDPFLFFSFASLQYCETKTVTAMSDVLPSESDVRSFLECYTQSELRSMTGFELEDLEFIYKKYCGASTPISSM